MRLPRMTMRRWTVVVVVVGLVMGIAGVGHRLKRRHDYLLSRAQYYAAMEETCRTIKLSAGDSETLLATFSVSVDKPAPTGEILAKEILDGIHRLSLSRAKLPETIAYHVAMATKYRRAARYPWLPIEPDPREPE